MLRAIIFLSLSLKYCLAGPSQYGRFVDFPRSSTNADDYRYAPIYKLNDAATLKWELTDQFSKSNFNITLWQVTFLVQGARQNPNPIFVGGPSDRNITYKWILQTFTFDVTISPVFYLAATIGMDMKFTSSYFNLTTDTETSTSVAPTRTTDANKTSDPVPKPSSSGSPVGIGVGSGIGILLLIALTAFATAFFLRRRKFGKAQTEDLPVADTAVSESKPALTSIQELSASGGRGNYYQHSRDYNGMHQVHLQSPVELGNSR